MILQKINFATYSTLFLQQSQKFRSGRNFHRFQSTSQFSSLQSISNRKCLLTCLVYLRACMLACLAYLHAWRVNVQSCLACSRAYVFSMLAYFVSLCAHIFYMLPVLKYAYVLACFFDIVYLIFFVFEKLTSKNLYVEKFLFIQSSIQNPPEHL